MAESISRHAERELSSSPAGAPPKLKPEAPMPVVDGVVAAPNENAAGDACGGPPLIF